MKRFTCSWIYNILVVLSDGKVVCGCADPYGERPLGNLEEEDILEIWNSDAVKKIREDLNRGYSPFCERCGLKRMLDDDEPAPQQPVHMEVLPRIFFEPTVLCNLSCFKAVCNHDSGIVKTRARAQFPIETFEALRRQIGPQLSRLDFFNYGDPFFHPQAVEMIELIKREYPHIFLYVSTNGLMLDREKIRRLVASGLDEITFSVDGTDQETYEKYRVNGDLEKVLDLMSFFVEERNRSGREVPFVNWRYILFNWNDSRRQMNKARKLAKKIGVDRLTWEITDHPEEAKSHRYQIGAPHWKKIYNEIWDSSQIGSALESNRYEARVKVLQRSIEATAHQPVSVRVKVKNTGGAYWWKTTHSGRRIIRLGAQLFDKDKNLIELNYARAFLNKPLEGGQADILTIELPPWNQPGEYRLKFDMVSEGIDWFESGGSPTTWIPFTVKS